MSRFVENIVGKLKGYKENSSFFSRNTGPKIVSIIFALVMWLYVMGEVNPEVIEEWKNVEVQLLNVQEMAQNGLVILGDDNFTVNVKVKGKRNELYKVNSSDIAVKADIRGFRKGVNSVPIEYTAPTSIDIEEINPKEIKVTLDEIITKQKPVIVKIVGKTTEGYEPSKPSVSPGEVIIEGPETIVNTVDSVIVNVNVGDKSEDIKNKLPLTAVNSQGKEVIGINIRESLVEVRLPIYKVKEVPILVKFEGEPKENYKITNFATTTSAILIKGPQSIVDKVNEIKTEPVNINGLEETVTQEIKLQLPSGIETPYLTEPPSIILTVEEIIKKEFEYSKDQIGLNGLNEKYIIDISSVPDSIKVEVVGVENVMKNFEKEDFQLYLNLKDLLEGKYSANLQYNLSIKADKITINPNKVDFVIKKDEELLPENTDEENTQQQD